jgi:hypothetical protein
MADNVSITAGSGTTIAADDIGGVLHQRVKLALGADGVGVDAVAGTGVVGTGVQRVTIATDDSLVTSIAAPTTGTQTIVASSATDVTILASNASRKGAYIYNDSTAVLYLLVGSGTSSTTVFTQKMAAGDAFNLLPGSYTGVIKGIWASATGNARVTEWT